MALSAIWFIAKTYAVILLIFWIRGTYPRLRIDQLMAFGWKVLVPLSFINVVITGSVLFYKLPWPTLTALSCSILAVTYILVRRRAGAEKKLVSVKVYDTRNLRRIPIGTGINKLEDTNAR